MIKPPKEMNIKDFDYFIVVKDIMVAGVYAEDEENIYAVHLKGHSAKEGAVTSCPKKDVVSQVEAGLSFIVKSHEEAMTEDLTNAISQNVIDFIKKKAE